jgi:hypothetical protein
LLFLKTQDGKSFTLFLQEVDALTLSEVKQGNIILDLVFRGTGELTRSDMMELCSVDADAPQATDLLRAKRGSHSSAHPVLGTVAGYFHFVPDQKFDLATDAKLKPNRLVQPSTQLKFKLPIT